MTYALELERNKLGAGAQPFRFRVVGGGGVPQSYEVMHEKELHLIVVRNDLSTFQHVHPERDDAGTWHIELTFDDPGDHTAFADVAPDGAGPMTLSAPFVVEGEWTREDLPAPASSASSGDVDVALEGDVVVGGSDIVFHVRRAGEPVELQPYLGAAGHLVAIRAETLDYLHVHPMESGEPGQIPFMIHAPSPGAYRLFLQFVVEGDLHTVAFTIDAAEGAGDSGHEHAHH